MGVIRLIFCDGREVKVYDESNDEIAIGVVVAINFEYFRVNTIPGLIFNRHTGKEVTGHYCKAKLESEF